jgi:hypothetical protein
MQFLLNFIRIKRANKVNKDGSERIVIHRDILSKKKITRKIFLEFYNLMLAAEKKFFSNSSNNGKRIELGAGSSFFNKIDFNIEKTDVVAGPDIARVVDATKMPYKKNEIKTFFGVFFFHHLQNPYKFLDEVSRCCKKNGGVILIEPFHGPLSRFIHSHMHKNEFYDRNGPAIKNTSLPMSDANQALSYIVFFRDKLFFEQKYNDLEIIQLKKINSYLRYIISGGINFKQLLPDFMVPIIRLIEIILTPISYFFCVHYLIVIKKK